jgi:hypothetical protein
VQGPVCVGSLLERAGYRAEGKQGVGVDIENTK